MTAILICSSYDEAADNDDCSRAIETEEDSDEGGDIDGLIDDNVQEESIADHPARVLENVALTVPQPAAPFRQKVFRTQFKCAHPACQCNFSHHDKREVIKHQVLHFPPGSDDSDVNIRRRRQHCPICQLWYT